MSFQRLSRKVSTRVEPALGKFLSIIIEIFKNNYYYINYSQNKRNQLNSNMFYHPWLFAQ